MAFERRRRSSSRSTITSILERSVGPGSSYDRLSVSKDTDDHLSESSALDAAKRRDIYFRAISPAFNFRSLAAGRAPPSNHTKSCTPSLYQQMAISELDISACGAESTCLDSRVPHNTGKKVTIDVSPEKLDDTQEFVTFDLIDLSDTVIEAPFSPPRYESLKLGQGQKGEEMSNGDDCLKEIKLDSKVQSPLALEPKVVILPTIQKEEEPVYNQKPAFADLPEDSVVDETRNKPLDLYRLRQQLTLSSEDSSVLTAESDCPIHGHAARADDVTVTLANLAAVGDSSTGVGQPSVEQTTSEAAMSKTSTDSKRYKYMAGSEKRSNPAPVELANDEDYHAGITYPCKYIGSMSMMKPTSKAEILSAMRRVRIEYKTRNTKKKKVFLEIGVNGVKVRLNKRRRKEALDDDDLLLMEEPICHIFYVSHDSHDNKIFSYISKKNPALAVTSAAARTNILSQQTEPSTFHCHVFKAYKKLQAVLIIQGLGRIFTICQYLPKPCDTEVTSNGKCLEVPSSHKESREASQSLEDSVFLSDEKTPNTGNGKISSVSDDKRPKRDTTEASQQIKEQQALQKRMLVSKQKSCDDLQRCQTEIEKLHDNDLTSTEQQEVQLLWLQVEHQEQQISLAVSEMEVLKQQVAIETQARNDAEVRCHQLLLHNKDLLEHINRLVVENKQLREQANLDHNEYNASQPILSSTQRGSPSSRPKDDASSRSVKTSPDSGHKEMSARSSQSDLLVEYEKLNDTLQTLATPTNSSYQLSSKFEQQMLQRKLSIDRDFSFTDMAMLRLSQSQLPSQPASQSENHFHSTNQSNMPTHTNGVNELDELIKSLDKQASDGGKLPKLANDIDDDKLYIANQSFTDAPITTPVVPYSHSPNAKQLLRDIMLSDVDTTKTVSRNRIIKKTNSGKAPPCEPQMRKKPHNPSVNDIYDKMKVIRRSLESMELSVGKHLYNVVSSPADEFTPQRKPSASSTPASDSEPKRLKLSEHIYSEAKELVQTTSTDSVFTEPEENPYEPIERRSTSKMRDTVTMMETPNIPKTGTYSRSQRSPHYENISCDSTNGSSSSSRLKRSETYLIRRSTADLTDSRSQGKEFFVRNKPLYWSCQSLSHSRSSLAGRRYPYAHQKVTTLNSPQNEKFDQLQQRGDHSAVKAVLHGHDKGVYSAMKPMGTYVQLVQTAPPKRSNKTSNLALTNDFTSNTAVDALARTKPTFKVSVRSKNQNESAILFEAGRAMSIDSLEKSVFENELDKCLERLIELPAMTVSQSSC